MCWFLDAGNDKTLRTLKLAGVQKGAKARSRGRLGGGGAASHGIWPRRKFCATLCIEKGTGKAVPISFYTTIAVLAAS
jgi:hypothetical protein